MRRGWVARLELVQKRVAERIDARRERRQVGVGWREPTVHEGERGVRERGVCEGGVIIRIGWAESAVQWHAACDGVVGGPTLADGPAREHLLALSDGAECLDLGRKDISAYAKARCENVRTGSPRACTHLQSPGRRRIAGQRRS